MKESKRRPPAVHPADRRACRRAQVAHVLVTLLSAWLMDRVGRRSLLRVSVLGMIAAIGVLTIALTTTSSLLAVTSLIGLVASFGIGMGPVPWLLAAELFPVHKCARANALTAISNWFANFVAGVVFLPMANSIGALCFVPFAVVLALFVALVVPRIPETRGKTLEQIAAETARDDRL